MVPRMTKLALVRFILGHRALVVVSLAVVTAMLGHGAEDDTPSRREWPLEVSEVVRMQSGGGVNSPPDSGLTVLAFHFT